MKPNQAAALRRRINRYTEASVEMAFIGSRDPDEHDVIEEEFAAAEAELNKYIDALVRG